MVESLKNWLLNDVKITGGNEHEAAEISKLLVKGWYLLDLHTYVVYLSTTCILKFPKFHLKIHMHCNFSCIKFVKALCIAYLYTPYSLLFAI